MKTVFVDTWAWVAMIDKHDSDHEAAKQTNQKLHAKRFAFATSNFVFGETITALRYQAGHQAAIDFHLMMEKLLESGVLTMLRVTEAVEEEAWQIFTKYHDQDFSWVDCTSFVLMKREKLMEAFTEDHHFRVMGFITHS